MLTGPLSDATGWSWSGGPVTDLPKKLRAAFPATAPGASGSTKPVVTPEAMVGAGATVGLLFPFTGQFEHEHDATSNVHWIWGRAADPARFPGLISALTLGNPLIALRFENPATADADAFPGEGKTRGSVVALTGTTGVTIDTLTIVAAYPLDPGLDTLAVLRDLRTRLTTVGTSGDLATLALQWAAFVGTMDPVQAPLRLLEPAGTPVSGRSVSLTHAGGTATGTLTDAHRGDILAATGVARSAIGAGSSLSLAASGEDITARAPGGTASTGSVALDGSEAHVDLAALNDWFAAQGSTALARFNRGCRITPFINGPDYFDDLFTALHAVTLPAAASGPKPLLYLAGYAIDQATKLASENSGIANRSLQDVVTMLASGNAEARFLALQFMQLKPGFTDAVDSGALVTALILAIAGGSATFFQDSASWDQATFFGYSQSLAVALFFAAGSLNDILNKLEPNKGAIDALAGVPGVEAFLDPYPATCADNPLCTPSNELVTLAHTAQERFNAFHQKLAIVRNDAGLHAYCGGIDLNPNRLDDRDHGKRDPFHDVHARVEGAAAGELATTFSERWTSRAATDLDVDTNGTGPLLTDGPDIVQVARTYFGPSAADPARALPFAALGERTILDTTLAAISRARRYIYIEDQYLTPPPEYSSALVAAAARVSGPLVILVPETPDQPFGLEARQRFIMDLEAAWGDRLKVGTMRGRFSRSQTTRKTAVGRLWLKADVAEGDTEITVGPPDRVPGTPFWLVVNNEPMRVIGKAAATGTTESVRLRVNRGNGTNLFNQAKGPKTAEHKSGTPATAGVFSGIYVHSKIMLIDDCFASIGSANLNRRGYYSDGECNIFALREDLTHGENWIRTLRTRLWSELSDVSDEFGSVALADPSRNLALFDRKFLTGNRFSPFAAQPYGTAFEVEADFTGGTSALGGTTFILKMAASIGQIVLATSSEPVFDSFIDPSSGVAP